MEKKIVKCSAWLTVVALAFAGAGVASADTVAKIGEMPYETLDGAFGAVKSGEIVLILNGTHDCKAEDAFAKLGTKTVTLKGESQAETILEMGNGNKTGVQTNPGTNLRIEDLTLSFDHSDGGSPMYHHSFYHPESQSFHGVTIKGQIDIMDDTLFENCTFQGMVNDDDEYLLWCYGCSGELVDCKFLGSGSKGPIKLYNEGKQCCLKLVRTSFATVGDKGCAVYSSNKYPDSNVYEITIGENVTVPTEAKLIRSSDTGLTVINPMKDEAGKYSGGTFESEKSSADEIVAIAGKYVGEGFEVVKNDDGTIGVRKTSLLNIGLIKAAQRYPWNGIVDFCYEVTNATAALPGWSYKLAVSLTADGVTKAVTNDITPVEGPVMDKIDAAQLFGTTVTNDYMNVPNATLRLDLLEVPPTE